MTTSANDTLSIRASSPTRTEVHGHPPLAVDIAHSRAAVACLRMFSSIAWLSSALVGKDAKLAPSFLSGAGLRDRIDDTFSHSAIAPVISDFLRDVVAPHAEVFAILVAIGDLAVGISLALGLLTRLGGSLAILRAATNIAIAGKLGMDVIGFNAMLAFAGGMAIATAAGRRWGVDAYLRRRWPDSRLLGCLA